MNEWLAINTDRDNVNSNTCKLYEIAIHEICTAILNVICIANMITETNADVHLH